MSNRSQANGTAPRVLITRTRQQASALAEAIQRMGAEPIVIPTIEVAPPATFDDLDHAIRNLIDAVDCLILTSANAATALANRAEELHIPLHPRRIAAIGPATAKAILNAGIEPLTGPVLLPETYIAESLAAALLETSPSTQSFLLVRAEEARDEIPLRLASAGHTVHIATAYRNVTPEGTLDALSQLFSTPESFPQVVTFTSSSTARNLVALLDSIERQIPPGIALASIGPITSMTLRELGCEPTFEAEEPTIEALAAAIDKYFNQS